LIFKHLQLKLKIMCGPGPSNSVTIVVSATKTTPFPPTISDGTNVGTTQSGDEDLTTGVGVGYTVTIKMGGDISAINRIYPNRDSPNLFSKGPDLQPDGTWLGVIGTFPKDTIESYSIDYTVNGTLYTQDPKIRINA
jgi:hypothetical protein